MPFLALLGLLVVPVGAASELHQATPIDTLIQRLHGHAHAGHDFEEVPAANAVRIGKDVQPFSNKTFNITAVSWHYIIEPSPFVVDEGDVVTLHIKIGENETTHGFFLETYAENPIELKPGATTIQFVANAPGTFSFICTVFCGFGHSGMGGQFTVVAEGNRPTVSSFVPRSGPSIGGTQVIVTGSSFVEGTAVDFGDVRATQVDVVSSTELRVIAPPHAPGEVALTLTNPDSQTATTTALFTYERPPSIRGVTPARGSNAGLEQVLVTGADFKSGSGVLFGDVEALGHEVIGDDTIRVITPRGPIDLADSLTVDVAVRSPDGETSVLEDAFTWFVPPPSIASYSPFSGPASGGTVVTLSGSGFSRAVDLQVTFGGVPAAELLVLDSGTIAARAPAHASGAVNIVVTTKFGTATATPQFTFGKTGRRRSVRH